MTNQLDSLNRRTNLNFSLQPSAFSLSFAYDPASRLHTVSSGASSATYSYLANSTLVEQITFRDGTTTRMTTTKTYDNLNRLTRISSVPSVSSVVSFDYAYNSANQRFAVTNADNSRWAYGYDALGQVTSGRKYFQDGTVIPGQQFDYSFDDIGNRKATVTGGDQWGANRRYASYSANALNQYTQRTVPGFVDLIGSATNRATVTVNNIPASRYGDYFRVETPVNNNTGAVWLTLTNLAVLQQGTNADIVATNIGHTLMVQSPEAFVHDADGNLSQDGRWTYTWDAENRLLSVVSRTDTSTNSWLKLDFGYDFQGRRISKTVSTWNVTSNLWSPVSSLRFVYDGWNLLAILNSDLSLLSSFTWGLDLSGSMQGAGGVGGLLMVSEISNSQITNHFAAYDGNGNVAALVKATDGMVSAQYEYGPFGELLRKTGPMARMNPFRWSTQYSDDESDLVMYPTRPYNPSAGRWLSQDPIGERGGFNLFAFVGNAPVAFVDPFGLVRINGPSDILVLYKPFTNKKNTRTYTADRDGLWRWSVTGPARIDGSPYGGEIKVTPTGASTTSNDVVITIRCGSAAVLDTKYVTIRRPQTVWRQVGIETGLVANTYSIANRVRILDQLGSGIASVSVTEAITQAINTGILSGGDPSNTGSTDAQGYMTDTHRATFDAGATQIFRLFNQTFTIGDWVSSPMWTKITVEVHNDWGGNATLTGQESSEFQ